MVVSLISAVISYVLILLASAAINRWQDGRWGLHRSDYVIAVAGCLLGMLVTEAGRL